jgi:hypothetical protein
VGIKAPVTVKGKSIIMPVKTSGQVNITLREPILSDNQPPIGAEKSTTIIVRLVTKEALAIE